MLIRYISTVRNGQIYKYSHFSLKKEKAKSVDAKVLLGKIIVLSTCNLKPLFFSNENADVHKHLTLLD